MRHIKRKSTTSIRDFLTEFEKSFDKTKSSGTNILDDVLAYRLLKAANLPTRDEQLVKATITELRYDSVKTKLVKIFSDNTEIPISEFNEMNIKPEPIYHTQSYTDRINYNQTNYENEATAYEPKIALDDDQEEEELQQTLYTKSNRYSVRPKTNQNSFQRQNQRTFSRLQQQHYQPFHQHFQRQNSSNSNWRNQNPTFPKKNLPRGKNPFDKHGIQTRCAVCQSINHWA